jgi:Glycosyl transferases group 1/SEC-C motif
MARPICSDNRDHLSRLLQVIQEAGLPLVVRQAPAPAAAAMYAQAQITFNCSLNGDLNMRVFEAMAAGGFLITDRLSPQSGLENLFQRDKHYVDYENQYDLLAKLRHYLAHPDECLSIARGGQEAYLKDHQPEQRVRDLLAFAFGDGEVSPVCDQRALAGYDGFGLSLNERVRLYEACQKLSLHKEQALVVLDGAIRARAIADLVDLPRLKIRVATHAGAPFAREALNRLGALDQIEFIEGEPPPCDIVVFDAQTATNWRRQRSVGACLVLVIAMEDVTDSQTEGLAAEGFSKIGEKLWVLHQVPGRNQPCPCGSGKRYKHCHGALV